jgi:hypothetical protein
MRVTSLIVPIRPCEVLVLYIRAGEFVESFCVQGGDDVKPDGALVPAHCGRSFVCCDLA